MHQAEHIRKKILAIVEAAQDKRKNPHEIMRSVSAEFDVSLLVAKKALNDLIRERKLVCTYRHPFTYVEIPCEDVRGSSRPMKVVVDEDGDPWICDCDVDPSEDLASQGCWQLRDADPS